MLLDPWLKDILFLIKFGKIPVLVPQAIVGFLKKPRIISVWEWKQGSCLKDGL
jgi:hypothetical protein